MLTLTSLANRIEQLEQEDYDGASARLDSWVAMIRWRFFCQEHGNNAKEVLRSLPSDHPMWEVNDKLVWFPIWKFSDALPSERDGWWNERVQIAFAAVIDVGIEDLGYSEAQLSTPEAMNEALEVITNLLDNKEWWEWFYDAKKAEAAAHENRLRYRREAHDNNLTLAGASWLKENDADFLENLAMKQSISVDDLIEQLLGRVATKPVETEEQRQARLAARIALMTAPPPPAAPAQPNGTVKVRYVGDLADGSFPIRLADGSTSQVYRDEVYTVTAMQFENMVKYSRQGSWQKVG